MEALEAREALELDEVPELDVEPVDYQAIIREALQELAEMRGDI